jgi:hypothetical protein
MTKENKPDHFAHALAYYRVGLSQMLVSGETGGVSPSTTTIKPTTFAVRPNDTVPVREALHMDLDTLVDRSIAKNKRRKIS